MLGNLWPLHSSEVISSARGVKVSSSALSTFECVFMLGEEVVGKSGQPNGWCQIPHLALPEEVMEQEKT